MEERSAISCKLVWHVAGMPFKMMPMTMGRRSLVLLLCCGWGACDGTQRDFDGAGPLGSETSGADATAGASAETSSASDVSTAGAATEGEGTRSSGADDGETKNVGETSGAAPSSATPSGSATEDASPTSTSDPESGSLPPEDGASDSSAGETSTGSGSTRPACDASLLRNGDFEAGRDGWSATSSYSAFEQRVHPLVVENGHVSLAPYPVTAHEGAHFAFLGDVPDDEYMGYHTTLTQVVTVPADSAGLWLTGYVWVNTGELDDMAYDYAYIQLEPLDDQYKYQQFAFWTNLDSANRWVRIDEYMEEVSDLRGREVNVVIRADTDANVATRFWFDSLQLVSSCPE